ncbi:MULTISPECIES: RNase H family protein [unclassified Micromonospora]|uniref:ribonuclease HI n=1 Tax=unclassified Micromonospora TaxID=2617518 RepID=UPI0033D1544B
MRPDEFRHALSLLPAPLYARALPLRRYVFRTTCPQCQRIGDAVTLALTAAHYDQLASAGQLLDNATRLAEEHGADCRSQPEPERGRGQVQRWATASAPVVAATDASWKGRAGGIGYVASDGRYGLRSRGTGRLDPTGASRVLINELRAVDFLLTAYDDPPPAMTVLVDSLSALRWLHRWQSGSVADMPAGYSLRRRRWADRPTLVRLAEQVSRRPDLSFRHVKAHSGHALNEAADGLSHMARRRVGESFDVRPRARALAEAFLRDWHASLIH